MLRKKSKILEEILEDMLESTEPPDNEKYVLFEFFPHDTGLKMVEITELYLHEMGIDE